MGDTQPPPQSCPLDLEQTGPATPVRIAKRLGWVPHRVAAVIYPLADAGRVLRTNPKRRASNQRCALAPDAGSPAEPAPEACHDFEGSRQRSNYIPDSRKP